MTAGPSTAACHLTSDPLRVARLHNLLDSLRSRAHAVAVRRLWSLHTRSRRWHSDYSVSLREPSSLLMIGAFLAVAAYDAIARGTWSVIRAPELTRTTIWRSSARLRGRRVLAPLVPWIWRRGGMCTFRAPSVKRPDLLFATSRFPLANAERERTTTVVNGTKRRFRAAASHFCSADRGDCRT
jgi:hypothetical protein